MTDHGEPDWLQAMDDQAKRDELLIGAVIDTLGQYALAAAIAIIGWLAWADLANADTAGPMDMVPVSECAAYAPAPLGYAPQFWTADVKDYAPYVRDPHYGVIKYPPHGTGGSGGHSPDVPEPSPVPLPAAGGLLAAALAVLGFAWRKWA